MSNLDPLGRPCPACGKGTVIFTGEELRTYTDNFVTASEKRACTSCGWKTSIIISEFRDSGNDAASIMQDILAKCHSCGAKLNLEPISFRSSKLLNVKCGACGSTYDISLFADGTRQIAIRELRLPLE